MLKNNLMEKYETMNVNDTIKKNSQKINKSLI